MKQGEREWGGDSKQGGKEERESEKQGNGGG